MRKHHIGTAAIFVILLMITHFYTSYGKTEQRNYTVYMTEYKFVPDTIEAPAGAEIKVRLVNKGEMPHEMAFMLMGKEAESTFTPVDENNVTWELELPPGGDQVVTIQVPEEPGAYQIVCGLPSHLEHGMQGKLIAVE